MRLWSLHPCYLDAKGLTALWREGLLARSVLQNKTRGYHNHPQLERFRSQPDPVAAIDTYLNTVLEEAQRRGYRYHPEKIGPATPGVLIPITDGQLRYELDHLRQKLLLRAPAKHTEIQSLKTPEPHPLFLVVSGGIATWEKGTADKSK